MLKTLAFIFDKTQYDVWRKSEHCGRAVVATPDIYVAHDLEKRGEAVVEIWNYLTADDLERALTETERIAAEWWKPYLSQVFHQGICLADTYQKDLWYAINTAIHTNCIVERILDDLSPAKVVAFSDFREPMFWDPTPTPPPDVFNAVTIWTLESRGIPTVCLSAPPREPWVDKETPRTQKPRTESIVDLDAPVVLNCMPEWARRRRVPEFIKALDESPRFRHRLLEMEDVDVPPEVLEKLDRSWNEFIQSFDRQASDPFIFSNRYLKFQFEAFWSLLKEGSKEIDAFSQAIDRESPSVCLFELDRDGIGVCRHRVAKSKGIPTATLFHGGTSSAYAQYVEGWSESNTLFVPGERDRQGFILQGRLPESVIGIGPFGAYRNQRAALPLQPTILIVTSSDYGLAYPFIDKKRLKEDWLRLVAMMGRQNSWRFIIKPHRLYDFHDFYRVLDLPPNVELSSDLSLEEALSIATLTIAFNAPSTATLASMTAGVPVVYFQSAIFALEPQKSALDVESVCCLRSIEELESIIANVVSDGETQKAFQRRGTNFLSGFLSSPKQSDAIERFLIELGRITKGMPSSRPSKGTRKRILFLSHSSDWNGAENTLFSILTGLDNDKFDAVVGLPSTDGVLAEKIRQRGIDARLVPIKWWVGSLNDQTQGYSRFGTGLRARVDNLTKFIRNDDIDVVFTNTSVFLEGALAAKLCGVPHLWYLHEILEGNPELKPFHSLRTLNSVVGALSDRVLVVSDKARAVLEGEVSSEKIEVVGNTFDPSTARVTGTSFRVLDRTPTVCFIGSVSERKGALVLVEVAKKVRERLANFRFLIVGADGGVLNHMKEEVRSNGLNSHFEFLGFRSDALVILSQADLLLLPSMSDPLPLVVLEAMSLGRPVVASTLSGATEMILEGETGYLVAPYDIATMSDRVFSLLTQKDLGRRLGEAGRQRVAQVFSGERYIRRIQSMLENTEKKTMSQVDSELVGAMMNLFEERGENSAVLVEQQRQLEILKADLANIQSCMDQFSATANHLEHRATHLNGRVDHLTAHLQHLYEDHERRISRTESFVENFRRKFIYRAYRFFLGKNELVR